MVFQHNYHFPFLILLVSVFVIHSLLSIASTSAQSIAWQRTYDGPQHDDDEAYCLCAADGANFYVSGYTGVPTSKAYTLKLNQFGDTIWTRSFGFGAYVFACAPTDDFGCVVAVGPGIVVLRKYLPNGDTAWQRVYGGGTITSISKNSDGTFAVCGIDEIGGTFNGFLMKVDAFGNMKWRKEYIGSPELDIYDVLDLPGEGFLICGKKVTNSQNSSYIGKVDTGGALIWEKIFAVNSNSYFRRIIPNGTGYILGGNTYVFPANDSLKTFLMRTDSNGDSTLTKVFPSARFEYLDKILLLGNNRFLTSVFTYSVFPSGARLSIFDSNFVSVRNSLFWFSEGYLEIFSVIKAPETQNGDLLCAGSSYLHGPISKIDFYVARIDSMLNMPPPIGILHEANTVPDNIMLFQNYPNPFNPVTSIKFDLPYNGNVKFAVYNVLGKEIYTQNENMKAGTHQIEFDGANLASGIYFYRLESKSFTETKKMVLLK